MCKFLPVYFIITISTTSAQITQVTDLWPGPGNAGPESLIMIADKLFFRADDGVHGKEWFVTDGTTDGTSLVKDIYPGLPGSSLPGVYSNYIAYGDVLLFEAIDTASNYELWRSDGTEAGTYKVKEIYAGVDNGGMFGPLQNVDGVIYFGGRDADHGIELWTSDGTDTGTYMICDIDATLPTTDSYPEKFYAYNGLVYFKAVKDNLGDEIWVTDGTCANTHMLKNLNNGDGDGSHPDYFTDYLGIIYFTAYTDLDGPIDTELWKSDGTAEGTLLVKDIAPGITEGLPRYLTVVNDKLCFSAKASATDYELWVSDGSEEGTVLLKDIFPGSKGSNPQNFTLAGTNLFFTADDGVNGKELWKTDGTNAGTVMVKNIRSGSNSSNPANLTAAEGLVYFTANNGANGNELWKSDGTEAGTVMVQDLNFSGSSSPSNLLYNEEALYFSATTGATGRELYRLQICATGFAEITPSGEVTFCKGEHVVLHAPADTAYSYQWKKDGAVLPAATAASYMATKSGEYQVEIVNGPCVDISESTTVVVYNKPNPFITNQDTTNNLCFDANIKLKTNAGADYAYQWYKGASPLAGATTNVYVAVTAGNYKVNVTNAFGCSKLSAAYNIINLCKETQADPTEILLFPNPNSGTFVLRLPQPGGVNVMIYMITGEQIFSMDIANADDVHTVGLDHIPSGMYIVHIFTDGQFTARQMVVE